MCTHSPELATRHSTDLGDTSINTVVISREITRKASLSGHSLHIGTMKVFLHMFIG